jgi:PHP family Zn ribbon phosphoesterase
MKLSYDLHMHSCLSPCGDGDMTPNNIVNMALLLGLDAIALSDHNSCKNLPAVSRLAEESGLLVLPAMEACTSEEVHVLCYFPTLESALAFDEELYTALPDFPNQPDIFGEQLILNERDEIIGSEPKLLINALTWDIEKLIHKTGQYGGIALPAHVNKRANSILANLGFIPEEYGFACIEVNPPDETVDFSGRRISDSDAHYLEQIHEPEFFLDLPEKSIAAFLDYFQGN